MSHLYRKVSDQFLEQIASGQRKVGDQLPPEGELAQEFGVSRSTLRMAFNELESGGVLHRQKIEWYEDHCSGATPAVQFEYYQY